MYIVETISANSSPEQVKDCCSKLGDGGVMLIADHDIPKAVLLSPADYEDYNDLKNREYLAKLDRAEAQFARGEYVTLTAEQLAAL